LLRVEMLDPPKPEFTAMTLSNLATVLLALGLPADAHPLLERAFTIAERTLPTGHPLRTKIASNLQRLLAELSRV